MIDNILKSTPHESLNKNHRVNFYFYGSGKSLNELAAWLKEQVPSVFFSELNQGLCAHEILILNQEVIQERHHFYTQAAEKFSIEYDGFDIELCENHDQNSQELNEFYPHFQAGDVFSYKTKDNKYILGVYYGGKYSDTGCFFNIYDCLFDSDEIPSHVFKECNFLYRTPVLLKIDSKKVNKINSINTDSEISCFFRAEVGEQSLDYFYDNDLIKPDGTEDDYLDLLLSMYHEQKILYIKQWIFIKYIINKDKITIKEDAEKIDSSYHFGVFGNMEMVESRLKGENRDLVFLSDEVFKISN